MRNHLSRLLQASLTSVIFLISCGGGGGSDSGGTSSGRTSKTGVRIINAAIDAVPLGVFQNEVFLSKASYLEPSVYTPVTVASSLLKITRGNRSAEVLRQINFQPEDNTEYSLLVLGEGDDSQLDIELIPEPIKRPEKGFGRIRFVNGLIGANNAVCTITDALTSNTLSSPYAVLSDTLEIPSGIKTFTVNPSSGARQTATFELADRGELLIVLAGKNELGFSTLKAISDLD